MKYRGIDAVTGKYVYGKWSPFGDIPCIEVENGLVLIKEESLAQCVGRDKKGREVYEECTAFKEATA